MYIQITTRCNMECDHCCYSCTSRGVDMPRKVFVAALGIAKDREEFIALGGGEPTVHPRFWDFLGLALKHESDHPGVWLATNGKRTVDALALASLASHGVVSCALSVDVYHEAVSPRVVEAFKVNRNHYNNGGNDYRETRTVQSIVAHGRAADWGDEPGCPCDELFVDTHGTIWNCGCKRVQFGTVFAPLIPNDVEEWHELKKEVDDAREVRA